MFKESAKAGLIGGFMGALMSGLANYYLISAPETLLMNAVGNAMSGLISGFLGGFIGVLMFIIISHRNAVD